MREKIYIFGAHSRGRSLAVYLQSLYPKLKVEAYLYNNKEDNPPEIKRVPVLRLDGQKSLHTEYPVYIATRGSSHSEISKQLTALGFEKIYPLTVELDLQLRNDYLKQYFSHKGQPFVKLENLRADSRMPDKKTGSGIIYVAKSVYDQALQKEYTPEPYERDIQVGAALTEQRLYPGILTDDTGENISEKNRQFCELTALYWIWKHAEENFIGLAHYRRHFILPEQWEEIMQKHQIDVVLAVPTYVDPSIEENYKNRHDPADWDFLMEYLKEQDETLYQEAKSFFAENLFSACNMFIMRKEVLNVFCSWLFPILDAVAAHGGQKEDKYWNRYPGFLSERLMAFYFGRSSSTYKMVYADKRFLP
ncbi:MAG: DUF4422 domain-containing protein [Lachnospiraceae bacterium]|nr:DUF4422 domain-containing protein [Lachnospiraceae bacterium]